MFAFWEGHAHTQHEPTRSSPNPNSKPYLLVSSLSLIHINQFDSDLGFFVCSYWIWELELIKGKIHGWWAYVL